MLGLQLTLYGRLEHLQTLTPETVGSYSSTESVATHTLVEALFPGVYATVLSSEMMALSMKQPIPPAILSPLISRTLHGVIDRAATMADGSTEGEFVF